MNTPPDQRVVFYSGKCYEESEEIMKFVKEPETNAWKISRALWI